MSTTYSTGEKAAVVVMTGFLGAIGIAFIAAIATVDAIIEGFVIATLWGWFVVPFGVAPIGIAWAIGLAALVGTVKPVRLTMQDEKPKWWVYLLGVLVLKPGSLLLIGYIAKGYM